MHTLLKVGAIALALTVPTGTFAAPLNIEQIDLSSFTAGSTFMSTADIVGPVMQVIDQMSTMRPLTGNLAFVEHDGDNNIGLITQTGNGNVGLIYGYGSFNSAMITQTGNNNMGYLHQTGAYNSAVIQQSGNGHAGVVMQRGTNNTAVLIQR